jgi:hypothetical protein
MDGSHHKWFEQRTPYCSLMNMVDDASGSTLPVADQEMSLAARQLVWQ